MSASRKAERLHWIKFNPTEWLGMFPDITDEEYGLLHKVVAKLWSTPGNRLSEADLLTCLRLTSDSPRAAVLRGLIGYALRVSDDGLVYLPALDDAFAEVMTRSQAAATGAAARWKKSSTPPKSDAEADPKDF